MQTRRRDVEPRARHADASAARSIQSPGQGDGFGSTFAATVNTNNVLPLASWGGGGGRGDNWWLYLLWFFWDSYWCNWSNVHQMWEVSIFMRVCVRENDQTSYTINIDIHLQLNYCESLSFKVIYVTLGRVYLKVWGATQNHLLLKYPVFEESLFLWKTKGFITNTFWITLGGLLIKKTLKYKTAFARSCTAGLKMKPGHQRRGHCRPSRKGSTPYVGF